MDQLGGQGQQGPRQYRPHSGAAYGSGDYYRNYDRQSPNKRSFRPNDNRPETEHPVPSFHRNQAHEKPTRDNMARNLPPKYFEIKPYLDNILSDQMTENKEVQRNLKDLKSLNERLLADLDGSKADKYDPPVKGSYWDQIQRLIMQIIGSSQNETAEFKASLQHLKNLKDRTLQEDLDYYEPDQPEYSYRQNRASRRPTHPSHSQVQARRYRPFSETFQPRTQNERRLMQQIWALRQENRQLRVSLNRQIEKNRHLSQALRDQNAGYSDYVSQKRVDDHSRYGNRSDVDLRGQLGRLSQRVQDVDVENSQLRRELRDLRQEKHGNFRGPKEEARHHIKDLETYVNASEKRAANYQSIKQNMPEIVEELRRLKYENEELRRDTADLLKTKSQARYKPYSEFEDARSKNLQGSRTQTRNEAPRKYWYKREVGGSYQNSAQYY